MRLLTDLFGISIGLSFLVVAAVSIDSLHKDVIDTVVADIRKWKNNFAKRQCRPFVVASFAQSLDGKIAPFIDSENEAKTTSNFPLSGNASLLLTHAIRSEVDAIVIGGRTLLIDNPKLTNRFWGADIHNIQKQPKAVVLDSGLHYILQLRNLRQLRNVRHPVVCCRWRTAKSVAKNCENIFILPCHNEDCGSLSVSEILEALFSSCGINTLMVEGGASVLTSFHRANAIDVLCLTIAPILVGTGIQPMFKPSKKRKSIELAGFAPRVYSLGNDVIFLSRVR
jgi:riboflavin-specific deaminase-like protein